MPNILRVALADEQRRDLRALLNHRDLAQYTRQRAECIRLLDQGRSVAEIVCVLECHPVTVHVAVHRFEKGGDHGAARCFAAGQALGARRDRAAPGELLRREGFRWKRTRDSVRHKADPILQQAARAQLEDLRTCGRPRTRENVN